MAVSHSTIPPIQKTAIDIGNPDRGVESPETDRMTTNHAGMNSSIQTRPKVMLKLRASRSGQEPARRSGGPSFVSIGHVLCLPTRRAIPQPPEPTCG